MKRFMFCMVVLMVLLAGCSGAATDSNDTSNQSNGTSDNTTNEGLKEEQDNGQNTNFNQFADAPEDSIALMVNLPSAEQISRLNISEILYLQETDEKIIFIPRYEHSTIEIYTVDDINEAGEITASKFYSNKDCSKDFSIELQAIRPEGLPNYKIWMKTPDGMEKECYISYNGKDGNPNLEYILNK